MARGSHPDGREGMMVRAAAGQEPDPDVCAAPRCHSTDVAVVYVDRPVCARCWERLADLPGPEIRRKLRIPEGAVEQGDLW